MFQSPSSTFAEHVLDAVPQIIWTASPDGACTYLNKAWFDFTGEDVGAEIGSGWVEALHPQDQSRIYNAWLHAASSGTCFRDEFRLRDASGGYRWMLTEARSQFRNGALGGWCGTCTDIHDRVLGEEALKQSERRNREVLESIPQVIWTSGADGIPNYVSQQWEKVFGGQVKEVVGESWIKVLHPDDVAPTLRCWRACLASGEPFQTRYRVRMASGEYHWTLAQALAARDEVGTIVHWCGSCTDIHEQVLAEQKVQLAEAQLRRTIDHIPQMIWSTLPDGHHDYFSPSWYEFTGVAKGSTDGEGWNGMFHPDDQERAWEFWRQSVATGDPYEIRYRLRHRSGEYRWVLGRARAERDASGCIVRWYGTCTDIHDQVEAEEARRESDTLHRSILEASADCIKITSVDGTLELMNPPGVCAMELGSFESVRGKKWASLWPHQSRETVSQAVAEAAEGKIARFSGFCPTATGKPRWWDVVVTPIIDEASGGVVRLLSISRDITAHRETAEELRWTSEHDALTSLPNRRSFEAHLQASTIKAMETHESLGLLLVDLDHFKHVNDTLGHAAGDHLLETFGERLKSSVRGKDFVARLGGDEFAVVLHGVQSENDLLRAGASILKRLSAPIQLEGRSLGAGASIGGAMFPHDARSAHELFKNADTALYALKASGRGGTRVFHSHMREQAQKVASQLSLARMAISEKSVVPHYQQKVDLLTGRIVGFEALLRWQYPGSGLQLPDTVAEAFKDYELASKIGALVQQRVFRDMAQWQRAGLDFGSIALNAAPVEFLRDDFAERLLERMRKAGVSPQLLEVEVTEHVFFERGSEYVGRALKLLHKEGVRIALDDFGTGYSSLSHLRDFPVDLVKIDRTFVGKMGSEPEIAAIVSAVIDLAKSLNIGVVAEGVETLEQEVMLRSKGCALGQGYRFGKACSPQDIPLLLAGSAAQAA